MTTRELTLSALALLAGAGGVYVLDKNGFNEQVVLAKDVPPVQVTGAAATAVLLDDAGQPRAFADGATVVCKSGGILDGAPRPDVEWCSDGKGQTWTRAAKGAESIQIVGGKVYSTAAP